MATANDKVLLRAMGNTVGCVRTDRHVSVSLLPPVMTHVKIRHRVRGIPSDDAIHHRIGIVHAVKWSIMVRLPVRLAFVPQKLPLDGLQPVNDLSGPLYDALESFVQSHVRGVYRRPAYGRVDELVEVHAALDILLVCRVEAPHVHRVCYKIRMQQERIARGDV